MKQTEFDKEVSEWNLTAYGQIIRGDENTSEDQIAEAVTPAIAKLLVDRFNEIGSLKSENELMNQVIKEFNSVFQFQWEKIIISVSQKYTRRIFSRKVEASIMFEIRQLLNGLYPPGFAKMLSISINSLSKEVTIKLKGSDGG
jgi:hypothetical protein